MSLWIKFHMKLNFEMHKGIRFKLRPINKHKIKSIFIIISCVTWYIYAMQDIHTNKDKDTVCPKLSIGRIGERAVARFLTRRGYDIVAKNMALYKGIKQGEIDILATKNGILYIVEVKANRTGWDRGDLFSGKKIATLKAMLAELYILKNGLDKGSNSESFHMKQAKAFGPLSDKVLCAIRSAKRMQIVLVEMRFTIGKGATMHLKSPYMKGFRCSIDFIPISSTF